MAKTVRELFDNDISRTIEEVIKVDQTDDQILREELREYVVTGSIRAHLTEVLDAYWEAPKKPSDSMAVWVSGFFGSGKSSFAKNLGLAIQDRSIQGESAADLLGQRAADKKVQVLLKNISEQIPTEAVIFDVSTDRGIRVGNQSITEIMYRLFLQHLGYARDLDLAELEITLEKEGRLGLFEAKFKELFKADWNQKKVLVAFAMQQASRVMQALEPDLYFTPDSWRESAHKRADMTPGDLAKRCLDLLERRRPGKSLLFVIDEVGQFVARDVSKMLDLQGVVQSFGRVGRGKAWIVVTSQERLTDLVTGLDDKRIELARLMDRFKVQVHLEPSDISEVTSRRVLAKNAGAEKLLRELFTQHRGRLTDNTRLSATVKLPELTAESFVEMYPLLPYQIDLIIDVVSGLRTQGGASKHVGGASRTIIKLAQQLLIHPGVNLAAAPVGMLARLDHVYDLVSGNIASEVRGKIHDIGRKLEGVPLAQSVAKVICLLQYVPNVHRTAENIAAALHPAVDADSRLVEVKAALLALENALMVRQGEGGYRIPTPAEDDWETQRTKLQPKPADVARLHAEVVTGLWQPQPAHTLLDVKPFTAGLFLNGKVVVEGDVAVHLVLAEAGKEYKERVAELRKRSQAETKAVFWAAPLDEAIDREAVEVHRSKEQLSRRERSATTKEEMALVAEERRRLRGHQDDLRRLMKQALLGGALFFRGNDRSPEGGQGDIAKVVGKVLSQALPEVFERFSEAAARATKKDLDALLTAENLRGLPGIFTDLKLIKDQAGKAVFVTDAGPLAEVYQLIERRTSYGEAATGKYLTDELAKDPFGWDFDVVRLLIVSLLRAGKLEATSKGQVIESALSIDARNAFPNNTVFRQASFAPKVGLDFPQIVDAAEHFKDVFGREISELEQGHVATTLREEAQRHEEPMSEVNMTLVQRALPGADVVRAALDQLRAIRNGRDDQAIKAFNAAHKEIKEAIKRCAELQQALTSTALITLERARRALDVLWPVLQAEADLPEALRKDEVELRDLLARETFYKKLADLDQHARVLEQEHGKRHEAAVQERVAAYTEALAALRATPGWEQLSAAQHALVAGPLTNRATAEHTSGHSIALLRAERQACGGIQAKAIEDLLRLLDGNRLVRVTISGFFAGGIDTEEQLAQALTGLQQRCRELIAAGKKVLIQ